VGVPEQSGSIRGFEMKGLRFEIFEHDRDMVAAFASHMDAADWCDGADKGELYEIVDAHYPSKLRYTYYAKEADMKNFMAWASSRV
jgi:uncharacterized protein (DUF2249 family)